MNNVMGKRLNRRTIFICLSLVWMGVIFVFSSRDGDESTRDSYEVGYLIGRLVISDFEDKTQEEQLAFAENIDYGVRKTAHATEYAVLSMLLCGVFLELDDRRMRYIPWVISTLYAATDEFHQLFVPGRDGNVIDICIDSAGALVGCMIIICFLNFRNVKKRA